MFGRAAHAGRSARRGELRYDSGKGVGVGLVVGNADHTTLTNASKPSYGSGASHTAYSPIQPRVAG